MDVFCNILLCLYIYNGEERIIQENQESGEYERQGGEKERIRQREWEKEIISFLFTRDEKPFYRLSKWPAITHI